PPPSQSQTTEVLRVAEPAAAAAARARSRSGSSRPPRPSEPTRRKSRRVAPSHAVALRDPRSWNMRHSLFCSARLATTSRWQVGAGLGQGSDTPLGGNHTQPESKRTGATGQSEKDAQAAVAGWAGSYLDGCPVRRYRPALAPPAWKARLLSRGEVRA